MSYWRCNMNGRHWNNIQHTTQLTHTNQTTKQMFPRIEVIHCVGPFRQAREEHFHHHHKIFPSLDQGWSPWQEQQLHHTCAQVHFLPNQSHLFPREDPWRMLKSSHWHSRMHERRQGRQFHTKRYCSRDTPRERWIQRASNRLVWWRLDDEINWFK